MASASGPFGPLKLSAAATRLLSPAAGPLEPPVRSVLFGAARFSEHGRSLALAQEVAGPDQPQGSFFPRLQQNLRAIEDARSVLADHARQGHHLAPAAAWLIDHGELLEGQFDTVRLGLPRRYFEKLPRIRDAPLAGLPRVYGMAWAWVAHSDSGLDEDLLELFISAYQSQRELTLAELWAIPTTLRVVLVENLRRLAERAAASQAARDAAHRWFERSPEAGDERRLEQLSAALAQRGVLEAFALQLQRRIDESGASAAPALRSWLANHLPDPAGALLRQQQEAAEDHQSVRHAVTSLRGLDRTDWRGILLRSSAAVAELQSLPVFAAESDATQDRTLHDIEQLARRAAVPESRVCAVVARLAVAAQGAAAAPQYWLRGPGRTELLAELGLPTALARWAPALRRAATPAYLLTLLAFTVLLVATVLQQGSAGEPGRGAWLVTVILLVLPASEAVLAVLHRLISESLPPRYLPRLALAGGIPSGHRVLVVVPALLTGMRSVRELADRLEQHHVANPERHAQFALLSDWADADQASLPADQPLLLAAREALERLNRRYPAPPGEAQRFLLLHRERSWSDSEQLWMGWERKRGKTEQLLAWLADGGDSPFLDLGALSTPAAGIRSLVTLDSDTEMPPGRLRELVAIAAHPMNVPVIDPQRRRVVSGYGILQPRVVVPLPEAQARTPFHWLFSGQWGVDPYSVASSEVYQDLFDEGTHTGKGLLDVRAVHATLGGRLPQAQVLSHDLLEGSLARCAAVSDVTLLEDAPAHPDVAASRLHRWTRGDWQLLPFLLQPRRWPMAGINRWKMADNLRRSLVAPASLLLLLWVLASGTLTLQSALLLVAAAYGAGPLLGAVAALAPPRDDIALGLFFRRAGTELLRAVAGAAWHLLQLLGFAMLMGDAVLRALVRQFRTRRRLLQWTTAAAAGAAARRELPALLRLHRRVWLAAGLLLAVLLTWLAAPGATLAQPAAAAWAIALCTLWASAPLWIWLASRPLPAAGAPLADAERALVSSLARDTWRFFANHVGEADNHLPPDNVQFTAATPMVAHRTSPTNIGLYLLATVAARELGHVGTLEMVQRLELTLATLHRLPRWRGHFYNWYDTRHLGTLTPAYVSAVDSGNLSGHLMVLAAACEHLADTGDWEAEAADGDAAPLPARLRRIGEQALELALAADFGALYDRRRRLLHIGYDVDCERLDAAHYDLLASEARLASLVGIAKGDLPPLHWGALGRPVFAAGGLDGAGAIGLKSWSGSMFEYLMPSLVLDEPAGSLLHEALRTAVAAQRRDGAARGMPWGVSESAIAAQDHTLAYQYGPQGVARLALRRTPIDERVVAPYASALALLVAPRAAAENMAALDRLGARRSLGFIEALDYTARRLPAGTTSGHTPVLTYMAHHHAMSLLACTHVLADGAVRRWAALSPHLRAVRPLLHERAPHVAPPWRTVRDVAPPPPLLSQRWQLAVQPRRSALLPTHVLGNERYAVTLRANGSGSSHWQGYGLTRWRDDALHDEYGLFGYLCRDGESRWQALSASPAPDSGDGRHDRTPDADGAYQAEFHPDRVLLHARFADLTATTTVSVSTTDDCELRQVELHNLGRHSLRLRVAMAFEPTLAPQRADEAHPAFSNLFVRAHWSPAQRALFLQRRPRLAEETAVHAVHGLVACDDPQARVHAIADRSRWLGRLGSAAAPLPLALGDDGGQPAGGGGDDDDDDIELATGLDPASVIVVELTLPPHGTRSLSFLLGAAADRASLRALLDRYQQPAGTERAQGLSDTLARIRLRELRLDLETWIAWLHLNTLLVNRVTQALPMPAEGIDRRQLWRHAIGGERPILVLWIAGAEGLAVARQLVGMLALWTAAGQALDLVVVNAEPASYDAPVQQAQAHLRELAALRIDPSLPAERRSALTLLNARDLEGGERVTLRQIARVWLQADGRSLAHQIDRLRSLHEEDRIERQRIAALPLRIARAAASAAAPEGRFDPDDAAFAFELDAARQAPRPWVNVLANPGFGCQVSESAGGHCWAGNSRLHQITAGANDALCDPPVEALWLQDIDGRRAWWLGRGAVAREVRHGLGSTRMRQRVGGLAVELEWCVDTDAAVRQLHVSIRLDPAAQAAYHPERRQVARPSRTIRRLRLVGFVEWTMGASRGDRASVVTRPYRWLVAPALPASEQPLGLAVLATQADASAGYGGATAFLCWRPGGAGETAEAPPARPDREDWTCDRREFFDGGGRWVLPVQLGARAGAGLDACGAVGWPVEIGPGQVAEATLLLGHGDSAEAAIWLAQRACVDDPAERLARQRRQWPALLDRLAVATPDPAFDALVNRWLPYQAIACRLWARAGYYQAGGAFGFRDQLQDAMNLALRAPQLLEHQIRLHAARQFAEGDVQHWWHPPGGAGVRTHISDDLLWLPLALAHALRHGSAPALLDEQLPFLEGSAVPEGREDIYETPAQSRQTASLFEHGARAIDHSLRTGGHGLPLMGSGDWNDGMNRVGHQGRGESVWLAWFLCRVLDDYAPLAEARGEADRVRRWREARRELAIALDRDGWDGRWYRRAFFDDGTPLGSSANAECRIDLIAQAWSVLSGAGSAERAQQAMASARELLWDADAGVMRLLDPPLAHAVPSAGYIQSYPGGIRENGGQYNHGAVWALMAFAQQGDAPWAWRMFEALSPAHRSADPRLGPAYGLEPYVIAGDIYSEPPYAGRGGWSWYTGAASWLQRVAVESICGLRIEDRRLTLAPCLPPHWPRVDLRVRHDGRTVHIAVVRETPPEGAGDTRIVRRGEPIELESLPDGVRLLLKLDDDVYRPPAEAGRIAMCIPSAGSR